LLAAGLVSLSLVAGAQDKDKPEAKLMGKWKLVKSGEDLPPGLEAVIEFAKEGKLKLSFKFGDKAEMIDGTWKLKEKKLELTMKMDGKEKTETIDIVKLDDKVLHTKDDKGKVDEFEKVKEEKK
jgi:uncharacterized protein (TIGR03066 family)